MYNIHVLYIIGTTYSLGGNISGWRVGVVMLTEICTGRCG